MKLISSNLLVMFFLLLGCTNDSPDTVNAEDDCIEQDSIPSTVVVGGDTLNITKKPDIKDPRTLEGRKERAKKSKVKDEKCCTSIETMQLCCCDEIAKKYKSFLLNKEWMPARNLKSQDPFYLSCQEKDAGFDKKITEIDDEILGK